MGKLNSENHNFSCTSGIFYVLSCFTFLPFAHLKATAGIQPNAVIDGNILVFGLYDCLISLYTLFHLLIAASLASFSGKKIMLFSVILHHLPYFLSIILSIMTITKITMTTSQIILVFSIKHSTTTILTVSINHLSHLLLCERCGNAE